MINSTAKLNYYITLFNRQAWRKSGHFLGLLHNQHRFFYISSQQESPLLPIESTTFASFSKKEAKMIELDPLN
jgi:hypothetical protein